MQLRWKELFTSKIDTETDWNRWDAIALVIAVITVVWVFALKLKTFYDLGYSGDLFTSVQAARSWLEGKGLLTDNCYGNVLAIHTYFLLLPLGFVAKPFGAPGLLFILAVSTGAAYFWAARILRLLGVAGPVAVIAAAAIVVSPFSVSFYQDAGHGFHVETLAPALCLMLFYFLLQQRAVLSIITGLAVISTKEDAPIAAAIVAIVAGVETWISSPRKRSRCRFNECAALVLILSILAIPLLLVVSWSQPPTEYARHSVDRLGIVAPGSLRSEGAFFVFVVSNVTHWLGSTVVSQWLWILLVGSLGTILLRPYYVVIGVLTTLVPWLMSRNDLLWTPRFFSTQTLLWCVTLIGFASITRAMAFSTDWWRAAVLAAAIVIAAMSESAQLALVSQEYWSYLVRQATSYSTQERKQADMVFARYRREGKPEEPVIASTWLFRYAHDRNLFWLTRLHGRPAPIWMLGDSADYVVPFRISADKINPVSGIRMEDYKLVDRRGRFVLLRKRE